MNYKLDVELPTILEPYRAEIEATIKPYIAIEPVDNNKPTWWQSKFGGFPYLPKNFPYPKSWDGEYLHLLAQINFAEVPNLEGFPESGILQFYIVLDDDYGVDYDNLREQSRFRVLYFADIDLNEDNLLTDFVFLPEISPETVDGGDLFPINGCCGLKFQKKYAPISVKDYQFDKLLFPRFKEVGNYYLGDDYYRQVFDEYGVSKIGGYPDFVQYDPRHYLPENEEEYILLLTIESYGYMDFSYELNINWNHGCCNFFISKYALQRLDFSKTLYYWDSA